MDEADKDSAPYEGDDVPVAQHITLRQLSDYFSAPEPAADTAPLGRTHSQTREIERERVGHIATALALTGVMSPAVSNSKGPHLPPCPVSQIEPKPCTFNDVRNSDYLSVWEEATADEFGGLLAVGAFSLATPPSDREPVGAKWVHKWKSDETGMVTRVKARLVAKGYTLNSRD
ncbi:unnamed protein product [Discosporangium mesarthrocarpum]